MLVERDEVFFLKSCGSGRLNGGCRDLLVLYDCDSFGNRNMLTRRGDSGHPCRIRPWQRLLGQRAATGRFLPSIENCKAADKPKACRRPRVEASRKGSKPLCQQRR
jgi:hypothetical protein